MNIIQQPNQDVIETIGGFQYLTKQRNYRLNKYCVKEEVSDGILLYNVLVGSLVFLKPYEYVNIYTKDPCDYAEFLVRNYFLVPENFDEEALVKVYRDKKSVPITETYLDHPNSFTILTTTTCNAHCFYCYELKSKHKTPMSADTAEKVAKYILEVAPPNTPISIGWFGGEPLFNQNVMDIITSRLRSAGRDIQSSIISNGYLFDKETAKKAKEEWKINSAQITLDGTTEIYNKTKRYIYKDDSNPFQTVINNIHNLLDNDIAVSIRMNCDKHNADDLVQLVKYLSEEFKKEEKLSMYVWPIFEEGFTRTDEQRMQLFKNLTRVNEEIAKYGKPFAHAVEHGIRGLHCMVDANNGITISPNGDIGLCEHYIDSDFISHIDNPLQKNWDIIKSWRNYVAPTKFCEECFLYPSCLKMHKCPDETICDEYERAYNIDLVRKDMRVRYELSKNNSCTEQKCHCNNCQANSVWQQVMSDGTIKTIQK